MALRARLITIPFSHYCEKARWALDRAGIAYVEEPHLPLFAWAPALRAGKKRTVPVFLSEDEEVVTDSHDVLAWVHRRKPDLDLYPNDIAAEVEALESIADRKVGPAARRLAYHALMKDPDAVRDLFMRRAPAWERNAARALLPVMTTMMKRGLKIDDAGAARSLAQLEPVLADVETRLENSGGPWLFGDRFTAADLTFASLMTPLVVPPSFAESFMCERVLASEPAGAMVERHRATEAGRFVLRAYERERRLDASRQRP